MDCDYAIKISLWIDGELSAAEGETVEKHLAACEECQKMEKDFRFFRQQLNESLTGVEYELPVLTSARRVPLWKRGISVPVPVLAVLLMIMLSLWAWSRLSGAKQIQPGEQVKNIEYPPFENTLSRFDKGGRAEIYVVSREQK